MSAQTPFPKVIGIGVALAAVLAVIVLAFSWPAVTAEPKDLPIAIAGPAAQVDMMKERLDSTQPGLIAVKDADDRDDAIAQIESRKVYGAIILTRSPEVLSSSAAGPAVAQMLATVASQLALQANAAAAAEGIETPALIEVKVTDVVPLADNDPRGTGIASVVFPLVLGGMAGGVLISLLVVGVWRRVSAVLIYAVVGGLGLGAILQFWFGSLQGDYLVNSAAIALTLVAIAGTIVGLNALLGRAGIGLGALIFVLIANPISAAAQPLEFLPQPWGLVGQWFPPGAAGTLLRELSYFPGADMAFPWLVLAGWAALGLVASIVGHFRDSGDAQHDGTHEAVAA